MLWNDSTYSVREVRKETPVPGTCRGAGQLFFRLRSSLATWMLEYRVLTSDGGISRKAVESHAKEVFGSVVAGLVGPSQVERGLWSTRLPLVLSEAFVEVELDWREGAVFVLFGLLVDGRRPSGYYVDDAGQRVRWHLHEVLNEAGHEQRVNKLRPPVKQLGAQAMLHQIDVLAAELPTVLQDLPPLIHDLRSR